MLHIRIAILVVLASCVLVRAPLTYAASKPSPAQLVLQPSDLPGYQQVQAGSIPTAQAATALHLATKALTRHGRMAGYAVAYQTSSSDIFSVSSSVSEYKKAGGAGWVFNKILSVDRSLFNTRQHFSEAAVLNLGNRAEMFIFDESPVNGGYTIGVVVTSLHGAYISTISVSGNVSYDVISGDPSWQPQQVVALATLVDRRMESGKTVSSKALFSVNNMEVHQTEDIHASPTTTVSIGQKAYAYIFWTANKTLPAGSQPSYSFQIVRNGQIVGSGQMTGSLNQYPAGRYYADFWFTPQQAGAYTVTTTVTINGTALQGQATVTAQ